MTPATIDLTVLNQPLTLPCGLVLPNRLAKAAMTEGLAGGDNCANDRYVALYRRWGEGGAGLLVTGNVHIDRWHLERGGNVAIEGPQGDAALRKLAETAQAAKARGSRIIVQLSHCGRQTQKAINPRPNAPSDVGLKMGNGRFGRPLPMTPQQIEAALDGLVAASRVAAQTGFDGVQLHGAHGYLISQFLSPLSNRRNDEWGGSLQNRARFVLEAARRIRAAVGPRQVISVKLNSADFQRGGFSEDDSVTVAKWLEDAGIDLLEVSGGNYEQPRMIDFDRKDPLGRGGRRQSTRDREAYFLDFVPTLRRAVRLPVMVTGGFRTAAAMVDAVARDGVDLIGLGRPLVIDPDGARKLLRGEVDRLASRDADLVIGRGLFGPASPVSFLRDLNAWGAFGWYSEHIYALADGRSPDLGLSVLRALLAYDRTEAATAKALRGRPPAAAG